MLQVRIPDDAILFNPNYSVPVIAIDAKPSRWRDSEDVKRWYSHSAGS